MKPRPSPARLFAMLFPSRAWARACAFSALALATLHAGPWPIRAGAGNVALSGSLLSAPKVVDAEGKMNLSIKEIQGEVLACIFHTLVGASSQESH